MRYLQLQTGIFDTCFGRRPFIIRHHLSEHALFSLPQLAELAERLPAASLESNAGNVQPSLRQARTPSNGLSAEETIRRIAECESWMALKNVEQHPAYRQLMEVCLEQVEGILLAPGMRDKEAFIFLSSPGAVTPYHMDPEQNFLLQIRGEKTLHAFDGSDRSILSQQEIEHFYSSDHRNLVYRDAYQSKAESFRLKPGLGLHLPVTTPHWVQNGPEVSVSFSITFQNAASLRNAHVHGFNATLRRMGLEPAAVGQSPLRDTLKQFALRAQRRTAGLLGPSRRYRAKLQPGDARDKTSASSRPVQALQETELDIRK